MRLDGPLALDRQLGVRDQFAPDLVVAVDVLRADHADQLELQRLLAGPDVARPLDEQISVGEHDGISKSRYVYCRNRISSRS